MRKVTLKIKTKHNSQKLRLFQAYEIHPWTTKVLFFNAHHSHTQPPGAIRE